MIAHVLPVADRRGRIFTFTVTGRTVELGVVPKSRPHARAVPVASYYVDQLIGQAGELKTHGVTIDAVTMHHARRRVAEFADPVAI